MGIRIQYDISEETAERLLLYTFDRKSRHAFARKALMEWINRQEGRDKRAKKETMERRASEIQEVIDAGMVKVK